MRKLIIILSILLLASISLNIYLFKNKNVEADPYIIITNNKIDSIQTIIDTIKIKNTKYKDRLVYIQQKYAEDSITVYNESTNADCEFFSNYLSKGIK